MGDLLDPRPSQWQRRDQPDDAQGEDLTLRIVTELMAVLTQEVVPTVALLAALRMAQKSVISTYQMAYGAAQAKALLEQATVLAAQYTIEMNHEPDR